MTKWTWPHCQVPEQCSMIQWTNQQIKVDPEVKRVIHGKKMPHHEREMQHIVLASFSHHGPRNETMDQQILRCQACPAEGAVLICSATRRVLRTFRYRFVSNVEGFCGYVQTCTWNIRSITKNMKNLTSWMTDTETKVNAWLCNLPFMVPCYVHTVLIKTN